MRKETHVAHGNRPTQTQQSSPAHTRNRPEGPGDGQSLDPGAIQAKAYEICMNRNGRGAPGDAIFEYVEVYYNRRRRHSTLVYQTLAEYEQSAAEAA
jgi:hypothetical protein